MGTEGGVQVTQWESSESKELFFISISSQISREAALNVTVVRLNLYSGASSTVLSFLITSGELVSDGDGGIYSSFEDEIWKVRLTNETVAMVTSESILVTNWRTGMRVVTREVVS